MTFGSERVKKMDFIFSTYILLGKGSPLVSCFDSNNNNNNNDNNDDGDNDVHDDDDDDDDDDVCVDCPISADEKFWINNHCAVKHWHVNTDFKQTDKRLS